MTSCEQSLSDEQRAALYRCLTLRDADFLNACFDALAVDEDSRTTMNGRLYEKLARREWSKLAVLDHVLDQSGYSPLSHQSSDEDRYDIDTLLGFAPDDDAKFVSMLIDFAAARSLNPDEGLQFEQLLRSGKSSRRDLLDTLVNRYAATLAIENGDVVALSPLRDAYTVCTHWRERLYLHPDASSNADFHEAQGRFVSNGGEVLSCPLTLDDHEDWTLFYAFEGSGERPIQIEVMDAGSGALLCAASASMTLAGRQDFALKPGANRIRIVVSSLGDETLGTAQIRPNEIKLKPRTSS